MDPPEGQDPAEEAMREGHAFLNSGVHERALSAFTRAADLFGKEYPAALRWYREALSLYAETGSEEKRGLAAENVARLAAAREAPAK